MPMKKVRSEITPTFFTDFDSDNAVMLYSMFFFFLSNLKV